MSPLRMHTSLNTIAVYGCLAGASLLIRSALRRGWERHSSRKPPEDPADPGVDWPHALLWGAAVGVAVGLARTLVRGGLSSAGKRLR